jgi:cytochrome P450
MQERQLNSMTQITYLDLLAQETKRRPIPFFARLREQEPLHHVTDPSGLGKMWIAMNYDDASAILKDLRFTKDKRKVLPPEHAQSAAQEDSLAAALAWRRDMITVDPPDHTRLRGLVSKAFTPQRIEQLRPLIQQITDGLLEAVQGQQHMDVIADFAFPLPITVLSELLGIPAEDRQQFRAWTQALLTPSEESQSLALLQTFLQYVKDLLATKHAHPASDLTSALVQGTENGDDLLSETELISTIWLLIIAGYETTVNLIGNSVLALLQHPEQMLLLQQDRSLLPLAIEELLRYTAPLLLSTPRWASEEVTMHGKVIRKGEPVFVSLLAANTDPQQFPNPARLDITRWENQHIAFGKGIHYCLGAPLARLEGQIAIGTLLQRLPNLRLACEFEQLTWTENLLVRGLTSLPVVF